MSNQAYFNLSIPAPRRLAMMRADFAQHAARYPRCPDHAKPQTWRDVRSYGHDSWQAAFCTFSQNPDHWYSHNGPEFRNERDAHDIADIRHTGWYTDADCSELAIGIVGRLTHGRFIAGYRWTSNDERVYYPEVFTDESDAARMADEHARVFAESAREDSERFDDMTRAESDVESAESEFRKQWILYRAVRHSWVADNARWHAAMVRATDDVQQCIEDIREARETLQDATADYNRG